MFERIMGLCVTDEAEYDLYRQGMSPILKRYGGEFGYDFKVSEVLKSKDRYDINRVFTIDFPSEEAMISFFECEEYLAVRAKHYDRSVSGKTVISLHSKA